MSCAADPSALIAAATAQGLVVATAESLTGGALVARLVDAPGASSCIAGGTVCYSSAIKARLLGVDPVLLDREGAVTAEVARQMAQGALEVYGADLAVSTTGVAGPGPDERGIPAGRVHIAVACRGRPTVDLELQLDGDRAAVRAATVRAALDALADALAPPSV